MFGLNDRHFVMLPPNIKMSREEGKLTEKFKRKVSICPNWGNSQMSFERRVKEYDQTKILLRLKLLMKPSKGSFKTRTGC